ncbi:MAG TPA: hypothetical protein VMY34_06530 [Acidimicrobiales bacterium]|nr:hypothetical protein [Acidimicrobiales bacterium]
MTQRLVIAVVLMAVAAAAAFAIQRRRPQPPTQARYSVPAQIDRSDFDRPEAPWLVVVFTSEICDSCKSALEKAFVLASDEVVVVDASWQARPDLHRRYSIDAAPTIVVADPDGIVRAAFTGDPTATDLWAAVAEARNPTPPDPDA